MAKRPIPTGTVTLLFTDIEGSTRMWELYPHAMSRALTAHNALVRDAVDRHAGYVFKTVGDAFCCAFSHPSDALAAAIDAQRRLQVCDWPADIGELRVRIGIYTGRVVQHAGDYFGPTVNRVARLTAIANGGQILVSAATADALAHAPLQGVTLRALGSHRLKDLRQAEETFQIVADGLRAEFPSLASIDAHPNNLPSQISSFVGRKRELTTLHELLAEHRVVTITGPGGIGKTRLGLQIAADLVGDFNGGTYVVALAPITDGKLVTHALAAALAITERRNEPLATTLLRYIDGKHMLLVFDNAEHVLTDVAAVVKQIVSECPLTHCLITGREPLHLVGENVERLAPLSIPSDAQSVADLENSEGSRLFLERARAVVDAELNLSAPDCAAIGEICRRLDGIPLAIELAASRLATMPLGRLAEKLGPRLLVNKDPTASQRHRTLRDAIEWSYNLLSSSEKRTFKALSVFHGGCTLEAISSVVNGAAEDEVESLVDKSLFQVDIGESGDVRYRLLEPIAEFAKLELTDTKSRENFERRHFNYYSALVAADAEVDNLRAAVTWASGHDADAAARLAVDLAAFWRSRGSFTEGRACFTRLLGLRSEIVPPLRASLLRQAAAFAAMQDDYERATQLAGAALTAYRDLNDESGMGSALHTIAEVAHRQGNLADAERLYREAYGHLGAADYRVGQAICLMNLGLLARQKGELAPAEALLREAESHAEALRDRSVVAQIHIERAWVTLFAGDADAAERLFEEALAAKVLERDLHGVCQARLGVATAALIASRTQRAMTEYSAALREAEAVGAQIFVIDAVHGIGAVHALEGDVCAAAKCCGLAAHIWEKTKCEARTGLAYDIAVQRISAELSDEQRASAMAAGATMRLEDAVTAPASATAITRGSP